MVGNTRVSAWSGADEILKTVLANMAKPERWQAYQVWTVWEEVVGRVIARKAHPQKIQNGKLFVTVSNSALMQELQFIKATLRDRLNAELAPGTVKDIFFVIGPVGEVRLLHQPKPMPQRDLPPFSEVKIPPLGNPALETALTRLAAARKRCLTQKGRSRGGSASKKSSSAI